VTGVGLNYLSGRVALVEGRVRALVAQRRGDDPNPEDPFRGLYLSDEAVDRLLQPSAPPPPLPSAERDRTERAGDAAERAGEPVRLRQLARAADLTDLDVEFLVAALAPDLDSRFERLYGYLNDDVTRRRATIGLVLELAGVPATSAAARARLAPGGPLLDHRLVVLDDASGPLLTRSLRVPDRVASHLLGDNACDPALADVLCPLSPYDGPLAARLAAALGRGVRLVYLRDRGRRSAAATAAAAVRGSGRPVLGLDLSRAAAAEADGLVPIAGREALLRGAAMVAGPVDGLVGPSPTALRPLTELTVPVLLHGDATWDPRWSPQVPLQAEAPVLGTADRIRIWHRELDGEPGPPPAHLLLGPEQIARAVRAARLSGLAGDHPPGLAPLLSGAREQNTAGLERLARRIEPAVGWPDLVLPAGVTGQLRELAARARHRDRVLTDWRMRPGGGRGHGITALFAGDSGTGKTMSAEVIAGELGLDLYTIDLATVVDKYVGETEKNLERIFAEAGGVNAVLLFDEADAVFGKRSEVRDAHDRYANIESAYLLQRMESFDGLAMLATNLRANIDDAFTRRLDAIVDFPVPDADLRRTLWDQCLGPRVPRAEDLDLDFCARAFEFSGGAIRSVVVTAAYLAADKAAPVGMAELITAVQREYRKLGRLLLEREFGPYHKLVC
jgi:winged helix domain-containing protein/ATPase family protein associated with various cellular activities (AAA)